MAVFSSAWVLVLGVISATVANDAVPTAIPAGAEPSKRSRATLVRAAARHAGSGLWGAVPDPVGIPGLVRGQGPARPSRGRLAALRVTPPTLVLPGPPELSRARSLQRTGVVAMAAGVLLGAGATVLAVLPACAPRAGNSCSESARWRAVATMGLPAGVLITGGVAMTIIGTRRIRRGGVVPSVAVLRHGATLALGSRF
ncbi:MAG: hypothetical protein B7733_22290 [Myxococcales bacterium FL481]|nr:MAG: hypothetical protein B7733_22290 [Myxococcales bacterium FL481]